MKQESYYASVPVANINISKYLVSIKRIYYLYIQYTYYCIHTIVYAICLKICDKSPDVYWKDQETLVVTEGVAEDVFGAKSGGWRIDSRFMKKFMLAKELVKEDRNF